MSSKKTDLDRTIKIVRDLISEKRKEIIAKRKELRHYEDELDSLISVEGEIVRVNKAFSRAMTSEKGLREALLSSMVPSGQQQR